MDITAIVITVAVCIGGLILLWGIIAASIALIGGRTIRKTFNEFDNSGPFGRR